MEKLFGGTCFLQKKYLLRKFIQNYNMDYVLDKYSWPAEPEKMARALELAARGLGRTLPNPCVGAVLVRDGKNLAEGWHKGCGLPHAEVECLQDAAQKGINTVGADLYVTLEPCNHFGRTPPCTKAIIEAGIKRVAIGVLDPNPQVAGGGASFLESQGLQVSTGVLLEECKEIISDFLVICTENRPYLILKLASTLDGRIASRDGSSRWITGPESRAFVHELRSQVQAVLIGGATFRQDNPGLDVRVEGFPVEDQPLAVILTGQLPDSRAQFKLLKERPQKTVFITSFLEAESENAVALANAGIRILGISKDTFSGGLNLEEGLVKLRQELGVQRVLCEGGGKLATALLDKEFSDNGRRLVDEIFLFFAPKILGDEQAISLFSGRFAKSLSESLPLKIVNTRNLGGDLLIRLKPDHGFNGDL